MRILFFLLAIVAQSSCTFNENMIDHLSMSLDASRQSHIMLTVLYFEYRIPNGGLVSTDAKLQRMMVNMEMHEKEMKHARLALDYYTSLMRSCI